jgi:hypothetical protein
VTAAPVPGARHVGGIQHGLVARGVQAANQPPAPLEHGDPAPARLGSDLRRSQAKLQTFLDQPRQAGSLPRRQRPGVGKQRGIVVKQKNPRCDDLSCAARREQRPVDGSVEALQWQAQAAAARVRSSRCLPSPELTGS